MDEVDLLRAHLVEDLDEAAKARMRRDLEDLWHGDPQVLGADRSVAALVAPTRVQLPGVGADAPSPSDRSARRSQVVHRRRSRAMAAASIAVFALILGSVALHLAGAPHDTPAAGVGDPSSVRSSIPALLEADVALRWPAISSDASDSAKASFEASQTVKIKDEVQRVYAQESSKDQYAFVMLLVSKALTVPQPVVDQTRIEIASIDDVLIEGYTATATVRYKQYLHVARDPHAPGQLASFVTDAAGWNVVDMRTTARLGWEGNQWKLIDNVSQTRCC